MTAFVTKTIRSLTDVLTKEQTQIIRTAGLLMVPALLTKITGLFFNLLTATQLGSDRALNEFLFANALPQLLADVLLTGAISTLAIPILIQVKEEQGNEAFHKFYNTIVNLMLGVFVMVSFFVIVFAHQIFPFVMQNIVRPDPVVYSQVHVDTIVGMMQVLMIPQLILGASVFLSTGLNAFDRLLIPQLAPLFYNIGRIFGVFILLPLSNNSPWALVFGVILGALLHFVIQIPLARMLGFQWKFSLNGFWILFVPFIDFGFMCWGRTRSLITGQKYQPRRMNIPSESVYVYRFFKVAGPRLVAYTADSMGETINNLLIAGYNVRFLSVMFYVNSLANIIPGIIGYAFSVASYPTLSRLYAKKDFSEINRVIVQTINQITFLSLPIVITLIVLRLPVVRLVYGLLPNTSFDRVDTLMVAWTMLFVSFGIIFYASKWYLYRMFYVAQNTVIPLLASFTSLGMIVVLTPMFANLLSHSDNFSFAAIEWSIHNLSNDGGGIAAVGGAGIASTLTAMVEFFLLLYLVNRYVVPVDFYTLTRRLLQKVIPTAATTATMYGMYKLWDTFSFPIDAQAGFGGSTTVNLVMLTGLTVFTSFMVYYLLCYLLNVEELRILKRVLNPVFRLGGLRIM